MKRSYEKLIKQMVNLGEQGHLGEDAKQGITRYAGLPNDIVRSIVYVNEFFSADIEEEARQIRSLLCQMVIVVYRDAKKQNPGLARAFANAFIEDFPQTSGTALLPRWVSLAEASFAFKSIAKLKNPCLAWQQGSKLVLATNEFLDGLLGLLIVAWRCALGKTVNATVLGNPYGSKVDEFSGLRMVMMVLSISFFEWPTRSCEMGLLTTPSGWMPMNRRFDISSGGSRRQNTRSA